MKKEQLTTAPESTPPAAPVQTDECFEQVLDYFIHNETKLLMRLQEDRSNKDIKREILSRAKLQFKLLKLPETDQRKNLEAFERYIWGYYILDDLIADATISDIKCYAYDRIRIKRFGDRQKADVQFRSPEDYKRFINMVAVKNQVNLSAANAVQLFTDHTGNADYRLRIDIATDFVTTDGQSFLHIRKIPKQKYSMTELLEQDFLTPEQAAYLTDQAKNASGIMFTGKGASGKTTLMNTLLDCIPDNKSGTVIQDSDELFSAHPDLLFLHTVVQRGEGRVQLDLKQLTTQALLMDNDYIIVGEVKGDEAAEIMKACYTGHQCWVSAHGMRADEALYKFADYIKQATDYEMPECMRMLTGFETIVYLRDWQVAEIIEIVGYDDAKGRLQTRIVDLPTPTPRAASEQERRLVEKRLRQMSMVHDLAEADAFFV